MIESRCPWPAENPLMIAYHDTEWGVPVHDDRKIFEFMVLDSFQAGLSWSIILKKREGFRHALADFDVAQIARFDEDYIATLLTNPAIIRNRMKIRATVNNAQRFLEVQQEFGTFDAYIWRFTAGKMLIHKWRRLTNLPAKSPEAEKMSADLQKRGFRFVGPTICYAFMQAAGMVNDHLISCFRYKEVIESFRNCSKQ